MSVFTVEMIDDLQIVRCSKTKQITLISKLNIDNFKKQFLLSIFFFKRGDGYYTCNGDLINPSWYWTTLREVHRLSFNALLENL